MDKQDAGGRPHLLLRIFGILLGLIGVVLAAGGIYLMFLGGSWYYAIAGLLILLAAIRTFRGAAAGMRGCPRFRWLHHRLPSGEPPARGGITA